MLAMRGFLKQTNRQLLYPNEGNKRNKQQRDMPRSLATRGKKKTKANRYMLHRHTYLHRLHRQGYAKDNAGKHIEDAGKDKRRPEINVPLGGEGDHQGEQRAQIAQRAGYLGQRRISKGAKVMDVEAPQSGQRGGCHVYCLFLFFFLLYDSYDM
jgi:hypothetical protein